ncbi:MAG: hypothetical protein OM95_03985 [Bdellovibrio sp. ArHS]|uniref:YeeE/YedE family protein n=1 Tax=Bdellovibrio sp. ArHS TaxID=1569284 RepID=UPI0005826D1B|nr:YeeE/YedE family protein [Bdellovibrio sp. ArHS]KHD89299.1 MAG: hypothetical protein OM95_03985 [Bdellovibrio sp. ArHS]
MTEGIAYALGGGALIGLSVSLLLICNGRVAGISGITHSFLTVSDGRFWRGAFLLGLLLGGFVMGHLQPSFFATSEKSWLVILVAGFLVGLGTVMGGGCTSGHGICGLSRLSPRSLVATMLFMFSGIAIATLLRYVWG